MAVRYYNDDCTYRLPEKRRTARWLGEVARAEGYTLGDVSYIFCSAARLLEMNRQYLGHDYYTDVITFDYSDRRGTHVVSGVLHLCGQRDKKPRTNAQMHRKEDRYLAFWHEEEASEQSAAPAPKRAKHPAHSKKSKGGQPEQHS